jgi:hypothetical protein
MKIFVEPEHLDRAESRQCGESALRRNGSRIANVFVLHGFLIASLPGEKSCLTQTL